MDKTALPMPTAANGRRERERHACPRGQGYTSAAAVQVASWEQCGGNDGPAYCGLLNGGGRRTREFSADFSADFSAVYVGEP